MGQGGGGLLGCNRAKYMLLVSFGAILMGWKDPITLPITYEHTGAAPIYLFVAPPMTIAQALAAVAAVAAAMEMTT